MASPSENAKNASPSIVSNLTIEISSETGGGSLDGSETGGGSLDGSETGGGSLDASEIGGGSLDGAETGGCCDDGFDVFEAFVPLAFLGLSEITMHFLSNYHGMLKLSEHFVIYHHF